MIKNIANLGDAAIYCDFGTEVNKEINSKVIKYFMTLRKKNFKGITNLSPSYNKLVITFDINETSYHNLKQEILDLDVEDKIESEFKKIRIPTCFHNDFSLDIDRLEKRLNKSKREIIDLFLKRKYFCYMTGFVAGMPFLGDTDDKIQLERLETPRVKVPKGSVGITEQFCNVYTYDSPGGWNVIGNTPSKIFDKFNFNNPLKIKPGDKVIFYEINKKEYLNWNE